MLDPAPLFRDALSIRSLADCNDGRIACTPQESVHADSLYIVSVLMANSH